MDNVKKFYLASVESADFKNAAEESRKMINSWVESQTNGRLWESHSLKITAGSPLCVNTVLDPDWASGNGVRWDWRGWGGPAGGGRSMSVRREMGGGAPRTSPLQAQLSLVDSVFVDPRSLLRLQTDSCFSLNWRLNFWIIIPKRKYAEATFAFLTGKQATLL